MPGGSVAKVELELVQLREALERVAFEGVHEPSIGVAKRRHDVRATIVPRPQRQSGAARTNGLRRRPRRRRSEVLVWIDLGTDRMIDGDQAHLIEVVDLFHRLDELEGESSVPRPDAASVNLDVLVDVRRRVLTRSNPVPDDGGTDAVRHELVLLAVPCEQDWTRAAASIDLGDCVTLSCGELHFVLDHACRPQQPDDVGLRRRCRCRRAVPASSGSGIRTRRRSRASARRPRPGLQPWCRSRCGCR